MEVLKFIGGLIGAIILFASVIILWAIFTHFMSMGLSLLLIILFLFILAAILDKLGLIQES